MMKIAYWYMVVVGIALSSFIVLSKVDSPETLINGTWQEVEWEYEKVNYVDGKKELTITGEQKKEICSKLVIHHDPVWHFTGQNRLLKIGETGKNTEELNWNVKGRGHILELKGTEGVEDYQIVELTRDRMVLYFNFDLQIRGIIKMTFKRIG
jgi:hypothetical protein